MNRLIRSLLVVAALAGTGRAAHASTILVEDFEAAFPAWESGWLGANMNLENVYGVGAGRGNNPDGLWISDGDGIMASDSVVDIAFNAAFGATLRSLSIDIAGYVPASVDFEVYDLANNILLHVSVILTNGGYTDPGTYNNYSLASAPNGIGGFRFIRTGQYGPEGWTSIDNVVVTQVDAANVPEPGLLMTLGAGFLIATRVRRRHPAA